MSAATSSPADCRCHTPQHHNVVSPLYFVIGATGCGKTDLSVALASALRGCGDDGGSSSFQRDVFVVNADAAQFFDGLPVATNRASLEELQYLSNTNQATASPVPHAFFAFLDPVTGRQRHSPFVCLHERGRGESTSGAASPHHEEESSNKTAATPYMVHHYVHDVDAFFKTHLTQYLTARCGVPSHHNNTQDPTLPSSSVSHPPPLPPAFIVCGGSTYYAQSLLLDDQLLMVTTNDEEEKKSGQVRGEQQAVKEEESLPSTQPGSSVSAGRSTSLWEQLEALDPTAASLFHPKDHRRISRALELAQQLQQKKKREEREEAGSSSGTPVMSSPSSIVDCFLSQRPALLRYRAAGRCAAEKDRGGDPSFSPLSPPPLCTVVAPPLAHPISAPSSCLCKGCGATTCEPVDAAASSAVWTASLDTKAVFWAEVDDKALLHRRLDGRVDTMVRRGLFDEIRSHLIACNTAAGESDGSVQQKEGDLGHASSSSTLLPLGEVECTHSAAPQGLPPLQGAAAGVIGVKELASWYEPTTRDWRGCGLTDEPQRRSLVVSCEEGLAQMKANTRRYAKQQQRWIRNKLLSGAVSRLWQQPDPSSSTTNSNKEWDEKREVMKERQDTKPTTKCCNVPFLKVDVQTFLQSPNGLAELQTLVAEIDSTEQQQQEDPKCTSAAQEEKEDRIVVARRLLPIGMTFAAVESSDEGDSLPGGEGGEDPCDGRAKAEHWEARRRVFHCELCDVTVSGTVQHEAHLKSKGHLGALRHEKLVVAQRALGREIPPRKRPRQLQQKQQQQQQQHPDLK